MPKTHYPYVVAIDWLQLHCKGNRPLESFKMGCWDFQTSDYPTAQFLKKTDIYYYEKERKRLFGTALHTPRLSVIRFDTVQLKVNNEQLYCSGVWFKLRKVLQLLSLEYKSVSRVDICADFNKFYQGLHPLTLIKGYLNQKYLKIGINRGYIAFDSMGYTIANGTTKIPKEFKLGSAIYSGITWGAKGYVQTQLYNKSKEMRDKAYKTWIVEQWEKAGLDTENVWRLEIRLQKAGKSLNLMETGDIFSFGLTELSNEHRLAELFQTYVSKYARFVKRDYHVKKQQMEPIKLFSHLFNGQASIKPKIHVNQIPTTRTTVVVDNFIAKLKEYKNNGAITIKDVDFEYHCERVRYYIKNAFPRPKWESESNSESKIFKHLDQYNFNREENKSKEAFFFRNLPN